MTVWTFTTLPAGTVFNTAYGINRAGQIVGGYISNNLWRGYLYSGGTYTGPFDAPSSTLGTFNERFGPDRWLLSGWQRRPRLPL